MDLPPEAIQEFKKIYKNEFGEDLSEAEAQEKASAVFNFLWMLCHGESDTANDNFSAIDKNSPNDKI